MVADLYVSRLGFLRDGVDQRPLPLHTFGFALPALKLKWVHELAILGQFPAYRPRRLRQSPALRRLVAETHLNAAQLVLPLFVRAGRKMRRPIDAMPGVFQLSPDELVREASRAHALGVPAVLLFGIPDQKDAKASGAYAENGIVQQTVRLLKKELPSLLVITDVCLCEYMEHGHCGIVRRRQVRRRENPERSHR